MFDLPVLTRLERKRAANFRLSLLDQGFEMAQYSVYMRFCTGQSRADTIVKKVKAALPPDGKVTVIMFTDKQYERMQFFEGGARLPQGEKPDQFALF